MRLSSIAFLLLSLVACNVPPTENPTHAAVRDLEQKEVALVTWSPRLGEVVPFCTGTWMSTTDIVTANHCVDDSAIADDVAYVVRSDVRSDKALTVRRSILVAREEEHDLALLRADAPPSHATAILSHVEPQAGDPVSAMSNPTGLWWTYTTGIVSAVRKKSINDMDAWWVQTTVPVGPGSSGGGLFDAEGNLLGVCHASNRIVQNANFYIHRDYVATFLWRNSK